mmetsp:Transcript_78776/g.218920  ORF Transcript_78776/g.218920 Transcript_78776/m.218920 type:complete len:772 (-) Transcript_78776:1232-3547(-)
MARMPLGLLGSRRRVGGGRDLDGRFGRSSRCSLALRTLDQRLHRQLDAALLVGLEHLDLDDLAFLQEVGHLLDALVGDLADVQQAVLAREQVHEGAEVQDLDDRAFVDLADFDLGRDLLDALLGQRGLLGIGRGDGDGAVFADVDGRTGLFGQRADGGAALADHVADLLRVDLHRVQARRELRHLGVGAAHGLDHLAEDVQAGFLGLSQGDLHDFLGDALDLDVHLQGGDARGGTGHLEVHVAQVIFVTQDVGQHCETVAVLDQAHGDASHVSLQRHAGVHQRQAAAADGGHRRRAVGLGDFGHHAQRVRELFLARQHGDERALGQAAVADFAALRAAHAARLAGGERGHVVVQHEAVFELAVQRVDALGVAVGAKRGNHQGLRLPAGEQGRTVGARQDAVADLDGAHGAGVAAVDARLAGQDLAAHDAGLDLEQQAFHLDLVEGDAFSGQCGEDVRGGRAAGLGAGLLGADLVGLAQRAFSQGRDLGDEGLVLGRSNPVPGRLAGFLDQLVDRSNGDIALLMAVDHSAQHDLFRQARSLGLDHQHGSLRTGDDQVHLAVGQFGLAGVQHVLAVHIADAGGADRAVERDARDGQRCGRADHRGDVGLNFRVQADDVDDDLDFVEEAFREQRADRAVDQAAGQGLVLGGAALTLEEAAGDLAGGVGLFEVVDGQREEVLAGLGLGLGDHGGQHDGAFDVDDNSATGLAGDFTRFQHDLVAAPLEGLGDLVEHGHAHLLVVMGALMAPGEHRKRGWVWSRCHSRATRQEAVLE